MRISDWSSDVCSSDLVIRVDFRLGFRDEQRISILFREVVENLVANGEVAIKSNFDTLRKHDIDGDFRFIVLERVFSNTSRFNFAERLVLDVYNMLKTFSLSEERGFGLDSSFFTIERVPLMRSDERRVGKECVSTCRYRGSQY